MWLAEAPLTLLLQKAKGLEKGVSSEGSLSHKQLCFVTSSWRMVLRSNAAFNSGSERTR